MFTLKVGTYQIKVPSLQSARDAYRCKLLACYPSKSLRARWPIGRVIDPAGRHVATISPDDMASNLLYGGVQ